MVCEHVMEPRREWSLGWAQASEYEMKRHNTTVITTESVSQKLSDTPSGDCGSQEGTQSTR